MNITGDALYKKLDLIYRTTNLKSAEFNTPPNRILNSIAGLLTSAFPQEYTNLMSAMTYLVLTSKYPNVSGWMMEGMDKTLIELTEDLCDAINQLYEEVR